MAHRICRSCSRIIEDADHCMECGHDEYYLFDAIIDLNGVNYDFEKSNSSPNEWKVKANGKEYNLVLEPKSGKATCSCTGFQYRGKCKHATGLQEFINKTNPPVFSPANKRHPRKLLVELIKMLDQKVLKGINYEVAGSYRRESATSKDIDILVMGLKKSTILPRLYKELPGGDALRPGDKKAPEGTKSGEAVLRWYAPLSDGSEIKLDFHFTTKVDFEPTLLYFTGSKDFNLMMRGKAKANDMSLNRYGLWDRKNPSILIARSEKDIFKALGIKYIPPKSR
jgi:hypothetical protein